MSETITEDEWTELTKQFSYNSMTLYGDRAHYNGTNSSSSEGEPTYFYGVQLPDGTIQALGRMRDDSIHSTPVYNSKHEKLITFGEPERLSDARSHFTKIKQPLEECKIVLLTLKQEVIDSEYRSQLYFTCWWGATIGDYTKLVDIHATEHDFGSLLAGTENFTYTYNTKEKAETRDITEMMV